MTTRSAVTVVLSCLMTIFLFAGCSDVQRAEDVEDLKPNNSDVIELNIKIIETDSGIEAFDICTEDFINSFNSYYAKDKGSDYLEEIYKWKMFATAPMLNNTKETMMYVFSQEPEARSMPQIKIYADSPKSSIYQVSMCYDDHSYSPETYAIYEELCYYTLKTVFPDKSKKEINELNKRLLLELDRSYTPDQTAVNKIPDIKYSENGIGVYPYNVAGDTIELRFAPLDQE